MNRRAFLSALSAGLLAPMRAGILNIEAAPLAIPASFTVGPAVTLVRQAALSALGWFWPDSGIGILNNNDGTYVFYASVGGATRTGAPGRTVGTLANPLSVSAMEITIGGVQNAPDATIAEITYQGGGPVYKDPATGRLILITHQERLFNPSFPGLQYYAWLGIATSIDDGLTWTDCGTIITPYHSFEEMDAQYMTLGKGNGGQYSADIGWGPYVIVGDYMYVYYFHVDGPIQGGNAEYEGGVNAAGSCVARALVSDIVTAAASATVPTFHKYHSGAWTELGIRGRGTPVTPVKTHSYAISYNTHRNRYIIMSAYGGPLADRMHFMYRESLDGIAWSDPQYLSVADPPLLPLHIYWTMVDPDSPVPYETGRTFYLIGKRWDAQAGEVRRWLITLTGATAPEPGYQSSLLQRADRVIE